MNNSFKIFNASNDDEKLRKLNILLFSLIGFLVLYLIVMAYSPTVFMPSTNPNLKIPYIIPNSFEGTNTTNIVYVATNILHLPVKMSIKSEDYITQPEYLKGDVVLIKYFNIYGLVIGSSLLNKNDYRILYRDNSHALHLVDIPIEFLLKPSTNVIHPFIFTQ